MLNEPRYEKTSFLHMRKQRRRSAAQLISAFVFATWIVQSLFYLNPKFQASTLTKMKRLQLGCCYYAAIKYVCNNWLRQSSQLERLVACLQQPCSFYQRLQAHRATTRSQLQLAAVTSKKTARTHSL